MAKKQYNIHNAHYRKNEEIQQATTSKEKEKEQ